MIVEYNKVQQSTNRAFYAVRVLPLLVSQLLFRYLAYVHRGPLAHQAGLLRMEATLYIFASKQGVPWRFQQMRPALQEYPKHYCGAVLGVAAYR